MCQHYSLALSTEMVPAWQAVTCTICAVVFKVGFYLVQFLVFSPFTHLVLFFPIQLPSHTKHATVLSPPNRQMTVNREL